MRVLALDPGLKTGIALVDTDDLLEPYLKIVPDGLLGLDDWWVSEGQYLPYDVWVVESFEAEEGTHGIDLTPVEIIGWIKSLKIPIVWQRRMQRGKGKLISVPVLKRAGLYPPRGQLKEGHQVAALMHALAYLVRIRHIETIQLLHPREDIAA